MEVKSNAIRFLQQDNIRLKDENQTLREELSHLQETIRALNNLQQSLDLINPETDVIMMFKGILASALRAVNSEDGSLQLLDEESGELVFVEVQGSARDRLIKYRLPPGEGIAGWVAKNRAPILVPDVHQDDRFSPLVDEMIGFKTASLICVPLLAGESTIGVIEVVNTRSGVPFGDRDLDVLQLVARLASMAMVKVEGPR